MSKIEQDSLEELLKQAAPRPVPSRDDEAMVRAAVREEWREATAGRRSRRRVMQYAVAATVVLGVFGVLNILRTPPVEAVRVASIEKTVGSVFVLGDAAELHEVNDEMQVYSGQTIVTRDDAGMALAWGNGGSLRVGANTRIEFTDENSVFLVAGRAYFDSLPEADAAADDGGDAPAFTLQTALGDAYHVGTQYMGEFVEDALIVSVREGEVFVDGKFHEQRVSSGHRVLMAGRQQPSVSNISRSGEAWEWVHETMPPRDVEGQTVYEFVSWVSRELGLDFDFDEQAEAVAKDEARLKGEIDTGPAEALKLGLASAALDWHIEEGVIYITEMQ